MNNKLEHNETTKNTQQICTLLVYYVVQSYNSWPLFWGNQSVPSSRVKKSKKKSPDVM